MSRDSSKPTTSKRAMEEDEDENEQLRNTKPPSKKKSQTSFKSPKSSTEELATVSKKQLALNEAAFQRKVVKEDTVRPLFFKPKFKLPESMAHHMLRRMLKHPTEQLPTWGVIEFFEGCKLISSYELSGDAPIHINSRLLLDLQTARDDISEYSDWEHSLIDGFVLNRVPGPRSLITMQRVNKNVQNETKFKVFNGINEYLIDTNDRRTIYDGGNVMDNMPYIRDMRSAFEFSSRYCCVLIAILGKFMQSIGLPQSITKTLDRDLISSMPYWLMIKVKTEFRELDRHLLRSVRLL